MKINFLCFLALLSVSCVSSKKTKATQSENTKIETSQEERKLADSLVLLAKKEEQEVFRKKNETIEEKDFLIEGETSENNDFVFYETKNKDTLRKIKISGIAKYSIQSKKRERQKVDFQKELVIQRDTIVKMVRDSVLVQSKTESQAKKELSSKEIRKKGFSFSAYFFFAIALLVVLLLVVKRIFL